MQLNLDDIYEHFQACYPQEGCGVITSERLFIPCTNVAEEDDDFIISSKEYLEICKSHTIKAIVHSHIDCSNEPSEYDISSCNALGIPYYIWSFPKFELFILEPENLFKIPLIGRQYKFGERDCLEAVRDYYYNEGMQMPSRQPYEEEWWLKGLNYFSDEHIGEWGFRKVTELKTNDLLIFKVHSIVPNHCGVYTGNDMFYHHAVNRLSSIENLYPLWKKYLVGIYRYEKKNTF